MSPLTRVIRVSSHPCDPPPTDDCVRGRGRFYQGRVNTTTEGILCQRWDSQHPHQHAVPVTLFPELAGAENYCRNAGGQEPRPWCFTTDSSVRWQYCDIPRCGERQGEWESEGGILERRGPGRRLMFYEWRSAELMPLDRCA